MITINDIKRHCMSTSYTRGRELYNDNRFRNVEVVEDPDYVNTVSILATVKGSGNKSYQTTVSISEDEDAIIDYTCECPAYESYYGMCKHCVATALLYRELETRSNSRKQFLRLPVKINQDTNKDIGLKEEVRKKMMTMPLRQETSEPLKAMIKAYALKEKAHLVDGYFKEIRLVPVIKKSYQGYEIEFKIGAEKLYVLKNIPKLIYDVEQTKEHTYGKNLSFVHDQNAFTDDALKWIKVLSKILKSGQYGDELQYFTYGTEYRTLKLKNYGIEQILEMKLNDSLEIDGIEYQIKEENPKLKLYIEPRLDKGAGLYMERGSYIYGHEHIYYLGQNEILKCSKDWQQYVWPLVQTLGANKDNFYYANDVLYLNKLDYDGFCGNVLPKIKPYVDIENGGVDFEDYMPKEAEFALYLSQDDQDETRINGKAVVSYGSKSHDLLEDKDFSTDFRDVEKEKAFSELIETYMHIDHINQKLQYYCTEDEDILNLMMDGLQQISQQGQVFADEKLKGIKLARTPKMNIGVGLSGELLELDVSVPDMSLDEVYDILSAYQRRKKYYRLKNGNYIQLENSIFSSLSELTQGLAVTKEDFINGHVIAPAYRTNFVDQVLKNKSGDLEVRRSTSFKQVIRNMRDYTDSDYEVPNELCATLRNYQKDGFRWLATLSECKFGGILADDMGLGKTIQMLAFLLYRQKLNKQRSLVVCPASLVYNWANEAKKFAPTLEVYILAGQSEERADLLKDKNMNGLFITSYDLLKRDISQYKNLYFDQMIIDEAQYIKNAGTLAAKAVKQIRAEIRFAMTGTPIENKLSDLWSIFDYIMPGYLYEYKKFKEELELPIIQSDFEDSRDLNRLQTMITPFIVRRKKQDVLKDLPDKLEEVIYTKMSKEQATLYAAHVNRLKNDILQKTAAELKKNQIQYLAELTKLRQLCCTPELLYEQYHGGSGKIDTCMDLIDSAIEGNHRILLFSQFTSMLDILKNNLEKKDIPCLYLSGKNTKVQRMSMVEEFQNGDVPVFLISLKAGGTGLNLTAADMVIHFDPWWNIAAQNQATDRTHRIGQTQIVNVIKLVAKDSIEERIIELQERKAKMSEEVIEGESFAGGHFSKEDLLEILE